MSLLRKSSPASEPDPAPEVEAVAGKGRPTPKRRDAAPKRQPVAAPRTAKEANRLRRQQAAQSRAGGTAGARPGRPGKMTTREYREALKRGDESVLPRRDKGPVRKFARDWVDTRLLLSNFLLVGLLVLLFSSFIPRPFGQYITIGLFVLFALEWLWIGRRIHTAAKSRFESVSDKPWVLGLYAGQRAFMPRRYRSPRATLRRGDKL